MRVSCERGHDRVSMDWDHMGQMYICSTCHYKTTVEVCESFIPVAYRNPRDPLVRLLMGLSKETQDFEVEVVIGMTWPPKIEYPRPSLDKFNMDLYASVGEAEIVDVKSVDGPPITAVHKDEVDLGKTRSGSFVVSNNRAKSESEYTGWENYVKDVLDQRKRHDPEWHLSIFTAEVVEPDPLLDEAPRGLFTREAWAWIKSVVGYTWRSHTGRLRVILPKTKWDLDGVKLWHYDTRDFGFSAVEKRYEQ